MTADAAPLEREVRETLALLVDVLHEALFEHATTADLEYAIRKGDAALAKLEARAPPRRCRHSTPKGVN